MHVLNRLVCLGLLCLSLDALGREVPQTAPRVDNEQGSTLELAGKMSVLAQRQAKLYLQLRLGLESSTSQRKLDEAVRTFDGLLAQLQAKNAPNSHQLANLWADTRQTLSAPIDMPAVKKASQNAEQLSSALLQVMARQTPENASPSYRLADLAARNAVLVQRLARVYMQQRVGDGDKDRQASQQQMRKDFLAALDDLARNANGNAALRLNLDLARQQWMFFDSALTAARSDEEMIRNVATTSERISDMMSEISTDLLTPTRDALAQAAR